MSITFTVFDSTGKIVRNGNAMSTATAAAQAGPGETVKFEGTDPETEAIDPGTGNVLNRVPMSANGVLTSYDKTIITANGVDAVTISNIPAGAIYEVYLPANMGLIQPPDDVVNDGVLIITTTVKGLYQVKLRFQNYLDFGVTINAN